jgi:PAS domain S-box-containing protein
MPPIRILIVEDDMIAAQSMRHALAHLGYEVAAIVTSGQEAVDRVGELHPDLVLIGVRLEGEMDGLEAGRQIRDRIDVPIIYVTADADDEALARARITDPAGYPLKSFRLEVLRSTLEMALYKHQAEKSLRESEARNRAILNALPDLMFVYYRDGTYLDYHAIDPDVLYAPPEQFLGKKIQDILPAEAASAILALIEQAINTGEMQLHEYRLPFAGQPRDFEARIVPYGQDRILSIVRDITGQTQVEEAYRTLVDHSLQGMVILQDGRVVFANPAIAEISGYSIDELLSLPPEEVAAVVHADDRDRVLKQLNDRLTRKEVPLQQEFRFQRQDGTIRWVATFATHIVYQGRPAVQISFLDITEKKEAEEAHGT